MLPLSFFAPAVAGLAASFVLWPRRGPLWVDLPARACLAAGLGLGICSCGLFVWSAAFGRAGGGFIAVEMLLAFCTIAGCVLARGRVFRNDAADRASAEPLRGTAHGAGPGRRAHRALLVAFLVSLGLAVGAFLLTTLLWPHGRGDAWAIWNVEAKFIFEGGERWSDTFRNLVAHSGYPLLVAATVARCWTYAGTETLVAPALVAMIFTFATAGLVFSSLLALRGRSQALVGTLVLLCTPYFILHGASQYADVPIAFFFLATFVLLRFHDRSPGGGRGLLALAGLSAGLATWTKNEGLLFLAAICVARLAVAVRTRRLRVQLREALFFAAGLLPVLVVVACFKMLFAPRVLWLSGGVRSAMAGVVDPSRWYLIAEAFVGKAVSFGRWRVSLSVALLAYLGLLGIKTRERHEPGVATSLATFCFMAAVYFVAYLTTPLDLGWHLRHSVARLILQLWPSFVFVFFLMVRTPEEALARRGGSPEAAGGDSPKIQDA